MYHDTSDVSPMVSSFGSLLERKSLELSILNGPQYVLFAIFFLGSLHISRTLGRSTVTSGSMRNQMYHDTSDFSPMVAGFGT